MVATSGVESRELSPGAPEADSHGLVGRQVGTGAMWSALNAAVLRGSTFVVSLIIVHLVAPYYFGVYTVAVTVFNIAISVYELGVSSAIIRHPERSRQIAPTIFTISLINSAVLAALMVVFAPTIAGALGAVSATSAIRVLAIVLLLAGTTVVPVALMTRDFMQREAFLIDVANFTSSTVVMLILVLMGHPVMGLAVSRVAAQIITMGMLLWMTPERYRPGWCWAEAKPLLAFGLPLAGSLLVTIAIANVDFVVVGHTLGARQLGYYNLAFSISGWPVTIFSAVLISVTLPTLSRVRHSATELTRHLEAGLSAVVAASLPVCALLAALAAPLIDTIYGQRWHPAWKALVVLSIFGAARTVLTLFSDLAIALGLTRRLLVIQLIWLGALTPMMVFSVNRWGIFGAGIAHACIVVLLVIPMYLLTVRRNTPVQLGWIKNAMTRPLLASLAVAGAAYGGTLLVDNQVWQLLLGLLLGLATYALLAGRWLLRLRRTLRDMYWAKPTVAAAGSASDGAVYAMPEDAMESRESMTGWSHLPSIPIVDEPHV
jgi:O-antigen/teichoic acid export membrane protein